MKMKETNAMLLIPSIAEKKEGKEKNSDIFSRLFEDRIIFLTGEINSDVANIIIAQLLYLDTRNQEPITIYINSEGGEVNSWFAIYDTMQFIKSEVITVCTGIAASMASVLLAGGTKGRRYALKHSEIMIHQPLWGMQGQAKDLEIAAEHIKETAIILYWLLSNNTGKTIEQIREDCDRNNFMRAQKALEYWLIDKII